jgi:hypothetical protein
MDINALDKLLQEQDARWQKRLAQTEMPNVAVDPTEDETFELVISFTPDEWEQIKSTLEKYDHKEMTKDEIMDRLKYWACKSIDSNVRSLNTPIGYNSWQ